MKDEESFVICDAKSKGFPIQYVSKGFQDLFGFDASECIGARCSEIFGSGKLIKDKPGRAALNKVADQLGLSEDQATAAIKRMTKAAEEAAQAACAGGSSQTVLLINSRKNGDLFACEMSLCLNRHPTMGWEYHAGLSRDVSNLISVSQLLKAASSESGFDELRQEFRKRTDPQAGAQSLQEQLKDSAPELHEIAEKMWKEELAKVFKPKDPSTSVPEADRRSIWSRSTASTIQSNRTKRTRSESIEAEGSDPEVQNTTNIPHLGAFFSQFTSESSEASQPSAPEAPVQPVLESDRFLDLLEGPESDEEENDSDGDERMAFATTANPALSLPKPATPKSPASPLESDSARKSPSDLSMESQSCSTSGESPMSDTSNLGEEVQDPVQLVGREVLLDLAIPLVMAAPTAPGFPVVLRSKGFEALAEPSAAIALGNSAIDALRPTSQDLQSIWNDFCEALPQGHFHTHATTGGGLAALEGFEDAVLPAGEFVFVRPFHCRSGKLVEYLVYLKQVELDNCPYLVAVHSRLPVAERMSPKERSKLLDSHFDGVSALLDDVISELASEFFYYAPMRRQRMRQKWPQHDSQQEEMLKAADSNA